MTREEAIRHLDTYSSTLGSGQTTQDQHEEAKRMAMEALEGKCDEVNQIRWERDTAIQQLADLGYGLGEKPRRDDCISRQAAIDALMAWEEDSFWDEECLKHRGEPFWVSPSDVIERLPSVQSERKKGKWLPDNNNYYEERFICSVCGRSYKVDTCMGKPMWDFCPCGADMRGEQE